MNKYKESDFYNDETIKIELENSISLYEYMMKVLEMYHQTINDVVIVDIDYQMRDEYRRVEHTFQYDIKKDSVEKLEFLKTINYNEIYIGGSIFTKSGNYFRIYDDACWFDKTNDFRGGVAGSALRVKRIKSDEDYYGQVSWWPELDFKYFFNGRGFDYPVVMNAYEELERTFQDWYNLSMDDIAVFYFEYDGKFIGDLEELKNITINRKSTEHTLYGCIIAKDGTEYIRVTQKEPLFLNKKHRELVTGYKYIDIWCKLDEEDRREAFTGDDDYVMSWDDRFGRRHGMYYTGEDNCDLWIGYRSLYPNYFQPDIIEEEL